MFSSRIDSRPPSPTAIPNDSAVIPSSQTSSADTKDPQDFSRMPPGRSSGAAGGTMRKILTGAASGKSPGYDFPLLPTRTEFIQNDPTLKALATMPINGDNWYASCQPSISYQNECSRHLTEAVKSSDRKRIDYLFAHEDFVANFRASSLLCEVARGGDVEVMRALLSESDKFNPNCTYKTGFSGQCPLVMAMYSDSPNRIDMVNILLEAGADVNLKYESRVGATPLQEAVCNDRDGKVVKAYLESDACKNMTEKQKADIVSEAFLHAINVGRIDAVKTLLGDYLGKNPSDEEKAEKFRTAMLAALDNYRGSYAVKELLNQGADVNAIIKDGKTAFSLAVGVDNWLAFLLVEHGAVPTEEELMKFPEFMRIKLNARLAT